MTLPVQIEGPDGVLRDVVAFATTRPRRFLSGVLPSDAVAFQVSINGAGFSSDPSLALWSDGTWTVPNPAYEPEGLALSSGSNTVSVRSITPAGTATPSAVATIRLATDAPLIVASPPTNVRVTQKDAAVLVEAEEGSALGFRGMNFYASTEAGGGASGYARVNLNLVSTGSTSTETASFGAIDLDADVAVDGDDVPLADPQYFRVLTRQEDENRDLLQSDLDTRFVIPETARAIRMTATLETVRSFTVYSFSHDRSATPSSDPPTVTIGAFAALPASSPLYYVVTAVYYDEASGVETESSFSQEVVAHPLTIVTALGSFPSVSRRGIVEDFIRSVFRSSPQLRVEPGSTLRDTVIDPFSSEAERLRFILDFLNRSRSPTLLLQIDDPTSSGTSVPVSRSPYKTALKQAFFLASDQTTQAVVDAAFEAYAGNLGVTRRAGQQAHGEATFYVTRRPTFSLNIPIGTVTLGGTVRFATTRAAAIDFSRLASYYDPVSGWFRVTVPVRAIDAGPAGNIGAGQLRAVVTPLPGGLSVTNSAAMFGGTSTESNLSLMERAQNRLAAVDSGTVRGYTQTAADVSGVVRVNVIAAGDPLMMRDLDAEGVHHGGKVDVWVQGTENIATVTDVFAFSYTIRQDVQFEPVGDPANLVLRAVDPELSTENPIVEVLDAPTAGYSMVNVSTGETFDLAGVTILSYDTIQLSTALVQPSLTLTDVVLGSFRLRAGNRFVLPRQPVAAITSVVGTVAGALSPSDYALHHPSAPLGIGRSILAGDYLEIDGGASGDLVAVTNEAHVLVGAYPEYLDRLGANFLSIRVWNAARTVEYRKPDDPSGSPDYEVSIGTQTVAASVTRVETGAIPSGAAVSIDYEHDENFTVTYTTNLITSLTQDAIDSMKHATADVVAKEGIPVPLDLSATVVLVKGRDPVTVDQALRSAIANFYASLRLGNAVRQSDLIAVVEKTEGVSYVVVPFSRMCRADGATVVWDALSTDTAAETDLIVSLSTSRASVYMVRQPLEAATSDGGGPSQEFRGVFQDEVPIDLLAATASLTTLGLVPGRAYIIGGSGRSIVGYSDDTTLIAAGYVTQSAIEARRLALTANRVLVSVSVGDSPTGHTYVATYVVESDSGAKDIDPSAVEYVVAGETLFTYDEDRA